MFVFLEFAILIQTGSASIESIGYSRGMYLTAISAMSHHGSKRTILF